MIKVNAIELYAELKGILGDDRALIVSKAAVDELERTEAWVEIPMKDFELLHIPLGSVNEEFAVDNQRYRVRVIRRGVRIAGRRVYKLHHSDNMGRVIRGWFGRILGVCWASISPTPEEREHVFKVINTHVQRELTYPTEGRHV